MKAQTKHKLNLEKSLEIVLKEKGLTINQFCKINKKLKSNIEDIVSNRMRSIGALDNLSELFGYSLWEFIKLGMKD